MFLGLSGDGLASAGESVHLNVKGFLVQSFQGNITRSSAITMGWVLYSNMPVFHALVDAEILRFTTLVLQCYRFDFGFTCSP